MSAESMEPVSASSDSMNRRKFIHLLSAMGVFVAGGGAMSLAPSASGAMPTLCYMDSYRGGGVGHTPLGCRRDILETMRLRPDWKLSLDEISKFGLRTLRCA